MVIVGRGFTPADPFPRGEGGLQGRKRNAGNNLSLEMGLQT